MVSAVFKTVIGRARRVRGGFDSHTFPPFPRARRSSVTAVLAATAGLAVWAGLAACSGGGPTAAGGLAVGGEWVEVSTLVEDGCEAGIEPVSTFQVTVVPEGNRITFVYHLDTGDFVLSGTFDPQTGAFTLTRSSGGVSWHQTGSFTSTSRYTSDSEILLDVGGGETCVVRTMESGQRA